MGDIFFIIKMMVITVLVVLFMQIRVGDRTIEQRSTAWLQSSTTAFAVRSVSEGALTAVINGYRYISSSVANKIFDSHDAASDLTPKARTSIFQNRNKENKGD